MKYIHQYICKLCPDVSVKSHDSGSTYYDMDGMTIRLSTHLSPICANSFMSITKLFNSDDFILTYKDTRLPLLKTRKEINEIIRIHYEQRKVVNSCSEANTRASDATVAIDKVVEKVYEDNETFRSNDWSVYSYQLGEKFPFWNLFGKAKKTAAMKFFTENKLRGVHFLQFILNASKTQTINELISVGNKMYGALNSQMARNKANELGEKIKDFVDKYSIE